MFSTIYGRIRREISLYSRVKRSCLALQAINPRPSDKVLGALALLALYACLCEVAWHAAYRECRELPGIRCVCPRGLGNRAVIELEDDIKGEVDIAPVVYIEIQVAAVIGGPLDYGLCAEAVLYLLGLPLGELRRPVGQKPRYNQCERYKGYNSDQWRHTLKHLSA